jgi:beta-ureidopropionase / N-carbamoyl-L-amino-acid hydrolase
MDNQTLRVNGQRLWSTLMQMAHIGALPHGGSRRLALSAEDKAGRDLLVSWCQQAGCTVTTDAIGNIFARRPGANPNLAAVATGSHLDTQPEGGKFDGVFGVLAGLEVIRTLNDAALETRAPIDLVVWTNEEGARFSPPLTGSGVFVGKYILEDVYSHPTADGTGTVKDDLARIGYLGNDTPGIRSLNCFIEAHIEQGPILETTGTHIGVVTQVQGIRWFEVLVTGQNAHAGTVPMTMRKDALVAAAQMIVALNALASGEDHATRLTIGALSVTPNSGSTIPGAVRFNIDLRHPSAATLSKLATALRQTAAQVARDRAVETTISEIMNVPPISFDPDILAVLRASTTTLGLTQQDILSGAGHDAMNIASRIPSAMIFIPCRGGVSHNESEYASPQDVTNGADVLLQALLRRAGAF